MDILETPMKLVAACLLQMHLNAQFLCKSFLCIENVHLAFIDLV